MEKTGRKQKNLKTIKSVLSIRSLLKRSFSSIFNPHLALALFFFMILSTFASAGDIIVKSGNLNVSQDLLVNINTLYANSTSNRVGIGTTTPSNELEVSGNIELTNLYDNDASNFFDYTGYAASKTVSSISSSGGVSYSNIAITGSQVSDDGTFVLVTGDTMTGDLTMTEGEYINLYAEDASQFQLGKSASGGTSEIALRTTANPSSGDPLFTVESSGYSTRLRVEHDGYLSTSNSKIAMNLNDVSWSNADGYVYFASDAYLFWDESEDAFSFPKDVGIGISTPLSTLEIFEDIGAPSDLGDFAEYQLVIGGHSTTGDTAGILLHSTADTYGGSAIVHYDTDSGGKGDLVFYTKQATGAVPPVEVMRLDDAGYVGIGTSSPVETLDVAGDMNLKGTSRRIQIGDGTDSQTTFNLDFTDISTTSGLMRMFRGTNTSGSVTFQIFKGDGTNTNPIMFNPNGDSWFTGGNVGIGDSTPTASLNIGGDVLINAGPGAGYTLTFANDYGAVASAPNKIQLYTNYGFGVSASTLNIQSDVNTNFYEDVAGTPTLRMVLYGESVGMGATIPANDLEVEDTSDTTVLRIQDSSNTCDFGVDGSGWASISCTSDEILKENITEVPESTLKNMANWIYNYPLKEYTIITNGERQIGVIAQEIQLLDSSKVTTMTEINSKTNETESYLAVQVPTNLDLLIAIQDLKSENELMKEELCKKDNSYGLC